MIFSDNTSAEAATKRGSARCFDQGCLVHTIWLKLAQLRCGAWVERVPTEKNIADLPSRESYALLERMQATKVEATLDPMFEDAQSWEALSVLGVFKRATPSSS